ncbi:MAG: arginine--tRNA ligase [Patescibacteria group bacterium]|nr:arginine--tRNA ligase [Patescibacteria group bacterium]
MKEKILEIIKKVLGADAAIELFVPEESTFGHYSTNVAMRMKEGEWRMENGEWNEKTIERAKKLAEEIAKAAPVGFFEKVEAVGPGFINFWLGKETISEEFWKMADGRWPMAESISFSNLHSPFSDSKVIIEFTDPNPFKLFHIGHLMSNAIGESIARLIEAQGADVKRLSYGGDVGLHVAKAIFGVRERMRQEGLTADALRTSDAKTQLAFWADAYVFGSTKYEEDESAKKEIDGLNKTVFEKSDPAVNELYAWGREISIRHFQEIFARLDTKFVRNYWESEVAEEGLKAVEKGLKENILEKSDGAVVFKGEAHGLHTRVFVNSKGVPTYEAKELGLTARKYQDFHFDQSIVITGNEQNDYFRVLLKAMDLLMPEAAGKTKHIGHGMLRFESGKMSSRKGNIIAAEALIGQAKEKLQAFVSERSELDAAERAAATEAIAIGAIKYSILRQNPGQDIVFDFEKSLSFEGDSGPYLQYAFARLRSILRKWEMGGGKWEVGNGKSPTSHFSFLTSQLELSLMRKILEFPDIVQRAGVNFTPSTLATYLHKLASIANKFYETTPILKDENGERRTARLQLAETAAQTIRTGLHLLGIKTLEKI